MLDELINRYPELQHYLELVPILFVGFLAGVASFCSDDRCGKKVAKVVVSSSFLCVLSYTMLSATDLPYLARVGISAAIGYFGIEKAIEIVQKVISLKNNGGMSDAAKQEMLDKRKQNETK